jgi:hypothetical protein
MIPLLCIKWEGTNATWVKFHENNTGHYDYIIVAF